MRIYEDPDQEPWCSLEHSPEESNLTIRQEKIEHGTSTDNKCFGNHSFQQLCDGCRNFRKEIYNKKSATKTRKNIMKSSKSFSVFKLFLMGHAILLLIQFKGCESSSKWW